VQTDHVHMIVEAEHRVSCACAPDAARGAKRPRLCPAELAAPPIRRWGYGSVLVREVVRGLGEQRSVSARDSTRRDTADVARRGRVAAIRADQHRGAAGDPERETKVQARR